jgi:inosine/xanthosine triphosphatase
MQINVGSKNQTKINAVSDTLKLYPLLFPNPTITGIDDRGKNSDHPKNLEQSISGAISRAKNSFIDCDYSFGIEGGLLEVPYSKSGYMETTVCAIYDGKEIHIGLGSCFEWPDKVTKIILAGEGDASSAFKKLNLTKEEKLGATKGGINGYLTNERLTREDQIKSSIINALIYIEHPELNLC